MRNFITIEEKGNVREFIIHDLSNAGLRIDATKHRNGPLIQNSPHLTPHAKQSHGSRVFNVSLHQMDTVSVHVDGFDLTVPIFLRWCFDHIRRSIKQEGLFRKSGGSQRIKELMARIDDGSYVSNLSSSNTVFDVCSLFKEFLRRLTFPLITHPIQDLLLDCFSTRSLSTEKKFDFYMNILLLLPDEHLHALIYILRFLHEITLHEHENKMNAKNLAICVGPGIMRTTPDGKGNLMTEQCATNVSDIVEILIIHAMKLGFITESIFDRSQMLSEMRQKEGSQNPDDSFALENGLKHGIGGGKCNDLANAKKRRSGSVKEFLVHMTNRFRRRSGSNNDSRDYTNAFLDQSGKFSSSQGRDYRYHHPYHPQNSIHEQCSSPTSTSTSTSTSKRKSSDDPNGSNSKRGKTKTTTHEKMSLPTTNRFTSPLTAFRRKKKTPSHNNDPGFPFKSEHAHLPQLLHFTDEVPLRFSNNLVNPPASVSSSSSSLATKTAGSSLTTLGTSIIGNDSIVHAESLHSSMTIPIDTGMPLLSNAIATSCNNNKSFDTRKLNLLDSWKWPKACRKADRKPLIAIHAPMLVTSTIDSSSLGELCPSPIKSVDDSIQTLAQQIGGSSLLMHSSFGVHRHHSDDITNTSFSTSTNTFRPRRSMSSSSGQPQTRHIVCPLNSYSHSIPTESNVNGADDQIQELTKDEINLNGTQEKDSFDDEDDEEENTNELNLAVMIGNEDAQSLRGFSNEPINQENTSLDEAFIDETDLERQTNANTTTNANPPINENEPSDPNVIQMNNEENSPDKEPPIPTTTISVLMEKSLNKEEDLDDILRRNENRPIRLTDSDDDDAVDLFVSENRKTPRNDSYAGERGKSNTTTPKMPVRLSTSISSLISSHSLNDLPLPRSNDKDFFLSTSLSQTSHDLVPLPTIESNSIYLSEMDENLSFLPSGRESILVLKDKLAGRVSEQVRAIERRSTDNGQNRSIVQYIPSESQHVIDAGELTRSVKRLQNTSVRREKE